jgi:lipopolysaccharide/colanic/teichoic acid biosynthesis glycosyltransferase
MNNTPIPWTRGAYVRTASLRPSGGSYLAKRALDLSLGTLLIVGLLPLLLLIAALIKIDSPGPVFFVHERVGARRRLRAGEPVWEVVHFPLIKYRSMVQHADQSLHEAHISAFVEGRLDTTGSVKLMGDSRVTRVGRWLRRTSFDELPQLLNVLRGEMSLVGPRPVPPYEAAVYTDWQRERLAALPGLTGLWQIKGRGIVSFVEMVQMDIEYVRTQSIWLDLKILLATIPAVLSGRGAA